VRARWLAAAGMVVAGGAAAGLIVATSGPAAGSGHAASGSSGAGQASGAGGGPRVATAPVVRTDLTNTVQVSGALGFASPDTVVNQVTGTAYTALPAPGQVVRRGQRLYEVDGSPVILLYGARPQWRPLFPGVTPGPDVAQLDANLIALGYATPATLAVSGTFTASTAWAVQRWQAAAALPVTGVVAAGQVAYAPGPLRVASLEVTLGAAAQPGTAVLAATSARRVVSAALPVGEEYLVHRGDQVTVTLPAGTSTVPGVVTAISRVASAGASASEGQPSPGPSASGGGGSGSGGSGESGSGGISDTVPLTVRLAHPRAAAGLDQAPVTVNIVSARARGVLAVPVSALVALAGGGYAVQVVQDGAAHLTGVRTGLFSSSLVQVSGAGLRAGLRVEVPAP
jgi:peptidoglycan hydrolase-like protein with peptidoglycan-binding domain